jgi:protein-arginine kinase activator protein McsA
MKCQHCHQNDASVDMQITINGESSRLKLCHDCARALQQQYMGSFESAMSGLMAPMSRRLGSFFGENPGFPFAGFFGGQPERAPARLSGASAPRRGEPQVDDGLRRRREIGALKAQLARAVETENFEEAIRLRDALRAAESADKSESAKGETA